MQTGNSIEIHGVTKLFGDVRAVDRVSLDVSRGEFFSLLGPSGCGKTTLLRMIAGLELPDSGSIVIDGRDMTLVPPYRRPVNLVFQHYALFPHLTAGQNVSFGLRYKGLRRGEESAKVAAALKLVRLSGLENRRPDQLSGGQRQRVALARALVLEPQVLLLDEPLAALDQKLRKEMQVELKELQRRLGITFIFVTHDQEEALTMSDRIAVMNGGRVEQLDLAQRIFEFPQTEFVAQFMGAGNLFQATVIENRPGAIRVRCGAGFEAELAAKSTHELGEVIQFVVRPEKMTLRSLDAPTDAGTIGIPVTVEERIYQGVGTVWLVRNASDQQFTIYEQNTEACTEYQRGKRGAEIRMCWRAEHVVILKHDAPLRAQEKNPA